MPKFSVAKSITIKAPVEAVHASVRDFKQWTTWSPWLIAEHDCGVSYADDGKSYAWDGKITGSGEMEILSDDAPKAIHYRLTFLKPWKSTSDVSFIFAEKDGGTEATWTMDGSLPFFMFWMTKMMTAFIGMDYERGLMMLKQHIENGKVLSKLDFPGVHSFSGYHYVGVRTTCAIEEIGEFMQRDFEKLKRFIDESGSTPPAPPFSIYHKWKPVTGLTEYTVAVPVESPPASPPTGMITGEVPACSCYVVRHTGPYAQLGNAWSAGMMHGRAKVFAQKRGIHPFEIYENDPKEVAESELVTLVHFPVKS